MKFSIVLIILFLISFGAAAPAKNSTATLVAKVNQKGFSVEVRQKFLASCKAQVEEPICKCVLKSLEDTYDEKTYIKFESDLESGIEDESYVQTVTAATLRCSDALTSDDYSGGEMYQGDSIDGVLMAAFLQSPLFKDSFVESCMASAADFLGVQEADKSCTCAFNKLVNDKTFLNKLMLTLGNGNGDFSDLDAFGFEFIESCLPKQFNAAMEDAFLKSCIKNKNANKATCECVLKSIKKDYTLSALFKEAFKNPKKLELDISVKAAKCLVH